MEAFIVENITLNAASSKIAKHKKICLNNQHIFISFMFDIFNLLTSIRDYGSFTNNSKGLPNKVQSIISMNIVLEGLIFS